MSPLLRDHIGIGLCPDKVILVRRSYGLRPRIAGKAILPLQATEGSPRWKVAVDKFASVLGEDGWKRADVSIVLSNHFVRYACLPWNDKIDGKEAESAFVSHWFTQTFGPSSQNWDLRISGTSNSRFRLASGIDDGLVDAISQACLGNSLRLRSIQPYLMSCSNRFLKQFKKPDSWFVMAEHDKLCIALIQGGEWRHVSTRTHNELTRLPLLLDRENLISGASEPCKEVLLFSPGNGGAGMVNTHYRVTNLTLKSFNGFSATDDAAYAMALTGTV